MDDMKIRIEAWKEHDELIAKASHGDRRAEALLVSKYQGLIRKTANEYRSEGLLCSFEDLVQEASIGFIEGLRKFDYGRGCDFTEWVKYSMRLSIRKCLTEKSRLVALPKWRVEHISKVSKAVDALSEERDSVSFSDLMRYDSLRGMKEEHVRDALTFMNSSTISLDAPASSDADEDRTVLSLTGSDEDFTERFETEDMLASFSMMLRGMGEKERTVVSGKLGLGGEKKTEKAIGEEIGLSPRSVRSIWQKTMTGIREKMAV